MTALDLPHAAGPALWSVPQPVRIRATRPPEAPRRALRIALYSPGMVGLGHMRRHMLIAQALSALPQRPTLLLIAEAREAGSFPMPPQVDCVTLPGLRKDAAGHCSPRHLPIGLQDVVALRAETIRATLRAFAPDVLIVDHLARGALGELQPALAALRANGRTRCILGLRDVLEEPAVVRREWKRWRTVAAIRAYYDAVWVYGDPIVYDLVEECGLPAAVAEKVTYTGYLDSRQRLRCETMPAARLAETLGVADGRLALCLVGGGQDGGPLAEAFAGASFPPDMTGVVVTGPFMPADARGRVHALAERNRAIKVVDFLTEPAPLLESADCVVAMGGYNSVCDVLSFRKRALIVPRGQPRREQLIRTARLGAIGAFDVLHPARLRSDAVAEWLARTHEARTLPRVDLGGLGRLPALLRSVLPAPEETLASAPAALPA